MKIDYEVVIIGSGVAGMTSAIYLKRSGVSCCLLEKEIPGGQITKSSSITNYPGILDISGPDFSNIIYKQVTDLGVTYKYADVLGIDIKDDLKIIKTDMGDIITKKIIIATGRIPKKLNIHGEEELIGKGISYCALCDGNFFKGEDIAVIGGGNSAIEEAIYLSKICKSVTIIHRKEEFRADKILLDKLKNISNIKYKMSYIPKSFNEKDNKLASITIIGKDNKEENLKVKGCFIYIGQVPNSKIFKGLIKYDREGYIKVNEHRKTNIDGIYAVGDVVKKDAYQLITAMNDGVIASVNCIEELKN